MNEFLQDDERLSDEEIILCAAEARLWEEQGLADQENVENQEREQINGK